MLVVFSPLISAETDVGGGDSDDGNQQFTGENVEDFSTWCETNPESCPKWLTANYKGDYAKTYFENKPEVSESNKDLFQRYLESSDSGETYTDNTLNNAHNYLTSSTLFPDGMTAEKDKTIAEKYCQSIYQGKTCEFDSAAMITVVNEGYPEQGDSIKVTFADKGGKVTVPVAGTDSVFRGEPGASMTLEGDQFIINGVGTVTRDGVTYRRVEGESDHPAVRFEFVEGHFSLAQGSNWKIQGKLFTNRESDYIMAQPGKNDATVTFNPDANLIVSTLDVEFTFLTEVNGKKYDVKGKGNYFGIRFSDRQGLQALTETTIKDGDAYATDALSGTATRFENAPDHGLRVLFGVEEGSDGEKALNGDVTAIETLRTDENTPVAIFTGTETVLLGQGKVTQKKGESDIAVEGMYKDLYTSIEGQKVQLATTEEFDFEENHVEDLARVNVDNQELFYEYDNRIPDKQPLWVGTTQDPEKKQPTSTTQVSFSTEPLDALGKNKGGGQIASINDLNQMRVSVDPTSTTLFNDVTAWDNDKNKLVTFPIDLGTLKPDGWYAIDTAAGTSGAPEAAAVSADATKDEAEESAEPAPDGETGAETRNSPGEARKEWTRTENDIITINSGLPDAVGLDDLFGDLEFNSLYIKQPDGKYYEVRVKEGKYYYTDSDSYPTGPYAAIWGGEEIYSFDKLPVDYNEVPKDPPTQEERDDWKRQAQERAALDHTAVDPPPDPTATAAAVSATDPATHCAHPGPPCD